MKDSIKKWAKKFKSNIAALYFAYRDPRTPLPAKILAVVIVGYAVSPIDLIPDFIPVLGYLDDVLLLPLLIWVALKMIPPQVMKECREKSEGLIVGSKKMRIISAGFIVAFWVLVIGLILYNILT